MVARRVGLLAFDGFAALDVVGPAEAFASAVPTGSGGSAYQPLIVGLTSGPVISESGLSLNPQVTIRNAPVLDTVIVPGGAGLRTPEVNAPVVAWLKRIAGRSRRIVTVCTGIYGWRPLACSTGAR